MSPRSARPSGPGCYAGLRDIGIGARENRDEALALLGAWVRPPGGVHQGLTATRPATVLDRLQALRTLGARPPDDADLGVPPDPEEGQPGDDDG